MISSEPTLPPALTELAQTLACLRGTRVRFTTAADLVNDLVAAQARNALDRRLALWTMPHLLVVDELGYLSVDARGADLLYQVFNRRYQRASTIVTTNLAFKDWGKLFHEIEIVDELDATLGRTASPVFLKILSNPVTDRNDAASSRSIR
jgi:DNA replication protein DnaC